MKLQYRKRKRRRRRREDIENVQVAKGEQLGKSPIAAEAEPAA